VVNDGSGVCSGPDRLAQRLPTLQHRNSVQEQVTRAVFAERKLQKQDQARPRPPVHRRPTQRHCEPKSEEDRHLAEDWSKVGEDSMACDKLVISIMIL